MYVSRDKQFNKKIISSIGRPLSCKMAPTKSSKKAKRVRPKLTEGQKETCRKKFADLSNAIETARESYKQAVCEISENHGRYVIFELKYVCYLVCKRTQRWAQQQLFLGCIWHCANLWNAFLQQKLHEANAGSSHITFE
jgi:hypothetical protein